MKKRIVNLFLFSVAASTALNAQWVQTFPYPDPNRHVNCFAVSGLSVFAGTEDGVLFSSADGISWSPRNTGLTNTSINAFSISGTALFAGTAGGGVFLSTNNGVGWSARNTGLTDLVVTALAISGGNIFAGTGNGGVFLSTNSGATWSPINNGLTIKSIVSFAVSGSTVVAGTAQGVFLSTNNGGNWSSVGLTNDYVYALALNGNNLFAGTFPDGVLLSANNGTSWSSVNSGLPSSRWVTALAVSGASLFAGTYSNGVFASFNNGTSWTPVNGTLIAKNIWSLAASGTYLFAGITGSGVYRRSLSEISLPPAPVPALPVDFATNVSVNPTLSWNSVAGALSYHLQLSSNPSFLSMAADDSTLMALSRTVGPLLPALTYFWRVRAKNDFGYGSFSATRQFTIVTTSIEERSGQIPSAFALGQNYPNPFNPSTIIRYDLPREAKVSLRVFNALGQVVATLIDGQAEAGYHQVQWNAPVPSGVYFYRLESQGFVETKKMILVR